MKRMKKYIFDKKNDNVLKLNPATRMYEIIGCHKDFNLHSDWSERYKEKKVRSLEWLMERENASS